MNSWIPGVEPVLAFKIVSLIVIFFLGLIASLLPLKVQASPRVLSCLNIMGGGVFLATGLCHLLADASESFEGYYNDFPMSFTMAGLGFCLTLVVEQVAHFLTHTNADNTFETSLGQSNELSFGTINGDTEVSPSSLTVDTNAITFPAEVEAELSVASFALLRTHYITFMRDLSCKVQTIKQSYSNLGEDTPSSGLLANDSLSSNHGHAHAHHDEDHGHSHGMPEVSGGMFVVFAIWIALSFHSIMEGLALGASTDKNDSIFIAIMAHKGLESFALGTSMVRTSCSKLKYFLLCSAFSMMTPIGIAIGILVESLAEDSLVSAYVTSIAAGTFLYVAVVEVILNELKPNHDKIVKLFLLLLGFALMAMVAIWV